METLWVTGLGAPCGWALAWTHRRLRWFHQARPVGQGRIGVGPKLLWRLEGGGLSERTSGDPGGTPGAGWVCSPCSPGTRVHAVLSCPSVHLPITCGAGSALAGGRVRGLGPQGGLAGGDIHPQKRACLGPALRAGLSHHFQEGHRVTNKVSATPGGRHT